MRGRAAVVVGLGTAQALAWASSVYLPAVLARPVAAALGVSTAWFFGAFSFALLLSAVANPAAGRAIDARGGRAVLVLSNLLFAAGLTVLALARDKWGVAAGWGVLGFAMALGLYEAAFATLAGLYGREARGAITGVTLIGGFASTIGWPVTSWLSDVYGWRAACLAWAAAHLLVGLPIHRGLPRGIGPIKEGPAEEVGSAPWGQMALLMVAFGCAAFVTSAIAAHLPLVLMAVGVAPGVAIATAALVGPAQVGARVLEFVVLRRLSAESVARLATALHPAGAAVLIALGAPGAAAFAVLHGAGNGMLTIARGTLPLQLFGAGGYGVRTGTIAVPARLMQAAAPVLFGVVLERGGAAMALALSGGLSLVAFMALLGVGRSPADMARSGAGQ